MLSNNLQEQLLQPMDFWVGVYHHCKVRGVEGRRGSERAA
jgi:hypothetical protein